MHVLSGPLAGLKDPRLELCQTLERKYRSHTGNCSDFGLFLPKVSTVVRDNINCAGLGQPFACMKDLMVKLFGLIAHFVSPIATGFTVIGCSSPYSSQSSTAHPCKA